MIKVSPSMLACDFTKMGEEILLIEKNGADMVHLDVMDGQFVPNISFGADIIKPLRNISSLPFDVHLMIKDPFKYISQFANAGADIISFHLESDSEILSTIEKIKQYNIKVGIAINPNTPPTAIYPFLKYIDVALIMTVNPGFGGQTFMENQLEKVTAIKQEIINKNLNALIEIDGGISLNTINTIKDYPVDICVSGTCVFKSKNMKKTIKELKITKKDE